MSRRTLALWATIMIVVFTITIVVYPLIFNPQNTEAIVPTTGNEMPLPASPALPGGPSVPPAK